MSVTRRDFVIQSSAAMAALDVALCVTLPAVGAALAEAQLASFAVGAALAWVVLRRRDSRAGGDLRLVPFVLVAALVAYFKWAPSGSPERVALAWAAWAYVPVSGVAGHARWTSDSYLYLSLAGLCIAVAALLERTLARRARGIRFGLGLAAAPLLLQVRQW